MASGTIIVRTRTSDAELPVADAVVAFYTRGQFGGRELLALRRTDSGGRAAPVVLQAPKESDSQQPEAEDEPAPYRIVDIVADHPDYERVTVEDVQVFDGIITWQDITLLPNGAIEGAYDPEEVFHTPGQEL